MNYSVIKEDKFAVFCVAVAAFLLFDTFFTFIDGKERPIFHTLLDVFVAASLLSSNLPRILSAKKRRTFLLRRAEFVAFAMSVICFSVMCLEVVIR